MLPESVSPARADKTLARHLPELPGWQLRGLFAKRDVRLNGQRIGADAIVSAGDVLHVFLPDETPAPLDIVLDDDDYLIVNKRQGMPVQGEGSVESVWLRQGGQPVFACHRLDVQTGGLVLLAKHPTALARAEQAFANHTLQKTYQAIVRGRPEPSEAALHAFLRKNADAAKVRVFDSPVAGAVPIETRYRVLTPAGDGATLLRVDLITGRTHQIRAHLAHIGHPILGDDKYGDRAFNRTHGTRRQKLWATRLTLWDGRTFEVDPAF